MTQLIIVYYVYCLENEVIICISILLNDYSKIKISNWVSLELSMRYME